MVLPSFWCWGSGFVLVQLLEPMLPEDPNTMMVQGRVSTSTVHILMAGMFF